MKNIFNYSFVAYPFSGCSKPQESLKQVDSNILDQYSMVEKKEDSIYLISELIIVMVFIK